MLCQYKKNMKTFDVDNLKKYHFCIDYYFKFHIKILCLLLSLPMTLLIK